MVEMESYFDQNRTPLRPKEKAAAVLHVPQADPIRTKIGPFSTDLQRIPIRLNRTPICPQFDQSTRIFQKSFSTGIEFWSKMNFGRNYPLTYGGSHLDQISTQIRPNRTPMRPEVHRSTSIYQNSFSTEIEFWLKFKVWGGGPSSGNFLV